MPRGGLDAWGLLRVSRGPHGPAVFYGCLCVITSVLHANFMMRANRGLAGLLSSSFFLPSDPGRAWRGVGWGDGNLRDLEAIILAILPCGSQMGTLFFIVSLADTASRTAGEELDRKKEPLPPPRPDFSFRHWNSPSPM